MHSEEVWHAYLIGRGEAILLGYQWPIAFQRRMHTLVKETYQNNKYVSGGGGLLTREFQIPQIGSNVLGDFPAAQEIGRTLKIWGGSVGKGAGGDLWNPPCTFR